MHVGRLFLFAIPMLMAVMAQATFGPSVLVAPTDPQLAKPTDTQIIRAPDGKLVAVWVIWDPLELNTVVSTDDGATWSEPVNVPISTPVHLALAASSPDVIDIVWADWEWIHHTRSSDGGATWSVPLPVMTYDPALDRAFAMAVSPEGAIAIMAFRPPYGEVDAVVTTSLDGGGGWSIPAVVESSPFIDSNAMLEWTGPDELLACWSDHVPESEPDPQSRILCRRSVDGGATFGALVVAARSGPGNPERLLGALAKASDSELVLAYQAEETGLYVVRSLDSGAAWSRPKQLEPTPGSRFPLISATAEGRYVAVNPAAIHFSLTGGSWSAAALPQDISCIDSPQLTSIVSMGESAIVADMRTLTWPTANRGDSWGLPSSLTAYDKPVGSLVLLSTAAGTFVALWSDSAGAPGQILASISDDGGATWSDPSPASDATPSLRRDGDEYDYLSTFHRQFAAVATQLSGSLFMAGLATTESGCSDVTVSRSLDGVTWEPSAAFARPAEFPISIAEDASGSLLVLWREGDKAVAARSLDDGASWSEPEVIASKPGMEFDTFHVSDVVKDSTGAFVFATNHARHDPREAHLILRRSLDGGLTWLEQDSSPGNVPYDMRLVPGASRLFLVMVIDECGYAYCYQTPALFSSGDDGASWDPADDDIITGSPIPARDVFAADEFDRIYWVTGAYGSVSRMTIGGVFEALGEIGYMGYDGVPPAGLLGPAGDLAFLYNVQDSYSSVEDGVFFIRSERELYRDDSITTLYPRPDLATIFPLEGAASAYLRSGVVPGMVDPDASVVSDAGRPIVFYGLSVSDTLYLVKNPGGLVQLFW